jgi:hypothetical protein
VNRKGLDLFLTVSLKGLPNWTFKRSLVQKLLKLMFSSKSSKPSVVSLSFPFSTLKKASSCKALKWLFALPIHFGF